MRNETGRSRGRQPNPMITTPQIGREYTVAAAGNAPCGQGGGTDGDSRIPAQVAQLVAEKEGYKRLPPCQGDRRTAQERGADRDPPDPPVRVAHGDERAGERGAAAWPQGWRFPRAAPRLRPSRCPCPERFPSDEADAHVQQERGPRHPDDLRGKRRAEELHHPEHQAADQQPSSAAWPAMTRGADEPAAAASFAGCGRWCR